MSMGLHVRRALRGFSNFIDRFRGTCTLGPLFKVTNVIHDHIDINVEFFTESKLIRNAIESYYTPNKDSVEGNGKYHTI